METASDVLSFDDWVEACGLQDVTPIPKQSQDTSAWFASDAGRDLFLKLYPHALDRSRAATEAAIAGANLHPAIVPLARTALCREGTLLVYGRVAGENLDASEARKQFQSLPLAERVAAVAGVLGALAAITDAGFMVVDWYEGNMIYDHARKQTWLFDWDLCRQGDGFTLEMDANYGSSRLMAPEEFVRGSRLDQQTTVFNLGRYALLTLPELAESLAPILAHATYPARAGRYASVQEFVKEFDAAVAEVQSQHERSRRSSSGH